MTRKEEIETINLYDWIVSHRTEEEMQAIFINMDRALKYIHEKGYCIEEFYPTEIEVLNNDDDYIQFKKLMPLPDDFVARKRYIQEDIFHSSLIQVGLYSNSLKYLTPQFLKENFDEFVPFLPNGDVSYYRGVIQRDASVYFCEYALEKRNRDLQELEKEFGEQNKDNNKIYHKEVDLTNQSVNDVIYRGINSSSERAYVNLLLIPMLALGMMMAFGVAIWFIKFFMT